MAAFGSLSIFVYEGAFILLKKLLLAGAVCLTAQILAPGMALTPAFTAANVSLRMAAPVEHMDKATLVWAVVPDAVQYQLVILSGPKKRPDTVVSVKTGIYTNGYELDTSVMGADGQGYYWTVCGLDFDGNAIGGFSEPQPLRNAILNAQAPLTTTEFDQMDYVPLYPAYSWIPYLRAASYEVEVWKKASGLHGQDRRIQHLYAEDHSVYDDAGYTDPGIYWWQVRALDGAGQPMSNWSAPRVFQVTAPVTVAALGDSITHGGGAISTPPGYRMYDWESYSPVAVKNLGFSGNTVQMMRERFETDVLPFTPKILVVMGGVNDYRAGTPAAEIIAQLTAIRDKCYAHGIIPVFATATPLNAWFMARAEDVEEPVDNWLLQQLRVNAWVMKQKYAVDVTAELTDREGNLRDGYTTDGLHPDMEGKRYIGETIGKYLLATFPGVVRRR